RAVYFRMGEKEPGRLLWVIHHLIVDGVSWRILLEDLQRVYVQLERGEKARLPAKTSAYQQWAQALQAYAESEQLQSELWYWAEHVGARSKRLPRDYELGANTVGATARVVVKLSVEETQALLQDVPKVYRTQVNDVLLTALAASLGRWSGVGEI